MLVFAGTQAYFVCVIEKGELMIRILVAMAMMAVASPVLALDVCFDNVKDQALFEVKKSSGLPQEEVVEFTDVQVIFETEDTALYAAATDIVSIAEGVPLRWLLTVRKPSVSTVTVMECSLVAVEKEQLIDGL